MKKLILCGALLCAFSLSAFAAQEVDVRDPAAVLADGSRALKVMSVKTDGTLNTGGAGGGGTSDATAANQTTQITAEQAILAKIIASPATAANQTTANTSLSTIATNTTTNVGSGTTVSSTALEASHVLKASAGTLIGIVGYNSKTSDQFIQVYNSTTVPADTAVPIMSFVARASSNFSFDLPITGVSFATGISVANSSTVATKTVGSADCFFTGIVK